MKAWIGLCAENVQLRPRLEKYQKRKHKIHKLRDRLLKISIECREKGFHTCPIHYDTLGVAKKCFHTCSNSVCSLCTADICCELCSIEHIECADCTTKVCPDHDSNCALCKKLLCEHHFFSHEC
jgi:hypothetical protein